MRFQQFWNRCLTRLQLRLPVAGSAGIEPGVQRVGRGHLKKRQTKALRRTLCRESVNYALVCKHSTYTAGLLASGLAAMRLMRRGARSSGRPRSASRHVGRAAEPHYGVEHACFRIGGSPWNKHGLPIKWLKKGTFAGERAFVNEIDAAAATGQAVAAAAAMRGRLRSIRPEPSKHASASKPAGSGMAVMAVMAMLSIAPVPATKAN